MKSTYLIGLALALTTCSHTEDTAKVINLVKICGLPGEMSENSGMTEYNGLLWNINDGGNAAAIYGFSAKDTLLQKKLIVKGAVNTDWEEISQDAEHLYIGDFGNNLGDRRDLRIYILDKADVAASTDSVPYTGVIHYSYEDQVDFTPSNYDTPYDCEAFMVSGDSIIVFTKDWHSKMTSLYTMPAKAGDYTARFRKRYNIHGLVTAANYSADKQELLLLGYQNFMPFIQVIQGTALDNFNFDESRRIDFSHFFGTQTEGIVHSTDGNVYVSCERSALVPQTLFKAEY
jgi:hypothetical protein